MEKTIDDKCIITRSGNGYRVTRIREHFVDRIYITTYDSDGYKRVASIPILFIYGLITQFFVENFFNKYNVSMQNGAWMYCYKKPTKPVGFFYTLVSINDY